MGLSYDEAMDCEVTKEEAIDELARHQESFDEFAAMHGDKETYEGKDVLEYLGW